MKTIILTTAFLCTASFAAQARGGSTNDDSTVVRNTHSYYAKSIDLRLGLNMGGTMPIGMPASIRSLNSYSPLLNPQLAATINVPFATRWGLETGLKIERQGMKTDANVKGYHMAMTQGDDTVEGYFTGSVVTRCSSWGLTLPVQATFLAVHNVKLRLGPYFTFMLNKKFHGYAYDGYLRKGTPTGERIEIGNTGDTRGEYTFNDDLRRLQMGLDLGVDWYLRDGYGIYADLQAGMVGAFNSSFKTIEQSMHPVYGTIGIIKTL